jgi:hypothetical protein
MKESYCSAPGSLPEMTAPETPGRLANPSSLFSFIRELYPPIYPVVPIGA